MQPARAPGSTTSTSKIVAEANLTPSPARLTRIREWLARTRLKERLTNARDAGSRRVTHGVYVLRASPRVMNDGRSHPDEAAAPSTSRYLTRVHDAESLEDLKPWRTRGIELFTGDDYLHSAGGALRGWDHLPLPECAPPTAPARDAADRDAIPEPPPLPASPRLYAAVIRSILAAWTDDASAAANQARLAVAEALREAFGASAETRDEALALDASTRAPESPTEPAPGAFTGAVVEDAGAVRVGDIATRVVEEDEDEEEETERSGGTFACCFGGGAKRRRDPSSSTTTNDVSVPRATAHDHAPESTSTHVAPVTTPEKTSKNSRRVFADANAAARSSSSSAPPPRAGDDFGELGRACEMVASAVWDAWWRSGGDASTGPLDAAFRAGLRPLGPETEDSANGATPPRGWRDAFAFFAAHHGASPTTVALAEAAAIARRWDVDVPSSVVSEVHVRLATAVSEIASGRASDEEAAHARVSAIILPIAEISLRSLLASPRETDAETAATKVRALTPVLALSMPLDTPAPMFANFLNRAASRAAMDRIARDLSTPLPGEARAVAEVEAAAARFVASGRDDDTDFASNLNASKAAFSRTGVVGETDGELAARTSLDVGRDSKFFTLARVVKAAETAVECFSTDLAVFRALPQGMAAARVAFHASAAALARAAFDATATAGSVWAPPFCATIEALDVALRTLHARMLENGLGSSTGALTAVALDDLIRPSLEEMLAAVRSRLALALRTAAAREKSSKLPPSPVAPARGAMHSASLVELFAALRDTFVAVMPATVCGRRRLRAHAEEVEKILGAALRWYAGEHERECLAEVRDARARLWENCGVVTRPTKSDGADEISAKGAPSATLTRGFHTRLSNIHACVASLRALREDCPEIWRASDEDDAAVDDTDSDSDADGEMEQPKERNGTFRENVEGAEKAENARFADLLRSLRCSRASVVAAASELLMDAIAQDLTTAVMSPSFIARRDSLARALERVDKELALMDAALASGTFRLAAASIHRAACAALERLVLHRAHDDVKPFTATPVYGTNGGSLSGTMTALTETQHSRIVEVAAALRDFLAADGTGVPAPVLEDGEQRLRRLLNLWFTPTVEVVREYWRQMDFVETGGGGAAVANADSPLSVVRPSSGGGVGQLDLIQLLAQRSGVSSEGEASIVVEAQLPTTTSVNAQAVLGLPPGEVIVATFVCRNDKTTLGGRLIITPSKVGFSPCGVGPNHPHDVHSAISVSIDQVVRAYKGEAEYGSSPALSLLLVDGRLLRFECFVGGARARDLALEGLRAAASSNHPQAPFLVNAVALASSTPEGIVLPPGETSRQTFSCTLDAYFVERNGSLFVTSAALLWLPSTDETIADPAGENGVRVSFENVDAESIEVTRRGWKDHMVSVGMKSKAGKTKPPLRLIRLMESSAQSLHDEIRAAMEAFQGK